MIHLANAADAERIGQGVTLSVSRMSMSSSAAANFRTCLMAVEASAFEAGLSGRLHRSVCHPRSRARASWSPIVVGMIREYLEQRTDGLKSMWVQHSSNLEPAPLGRSAVGERWQVWAKRAGVPAFTTHMTRHSSATTMAAADVPIQAVAEHLGHADLRTVTRYAQLDVAHRQRGVSVMDRLARDYQRGAAAKGEQWL